MTTRNTHPTNEGGVAAFNVKCEHCGVTHGSDVAHDCIEARIALRLAERMALLPKAQSRADLQSERDEAIDLLRKLVIRENGAVGVRADLDAANEAAALLTRVEGR